MTITQTVTLNLFAGMLATFATGAAGALICARWPRVSRIVGHSFALVGGLFALGLGLAGLLGGEFNLSIAEILPVGGVSFGLDHLSAFFITAIGIAAVPSSLYAIGYTREYEGRYSIAGMGVALNIFLASMALVVMARNVITFLALWEAMSLASYFLVMTEKDDRETERAGWLYLVMTHAGSACLLVGFLLLSTSTGSMEFAGWSVGSAFIGPTTRNLIFILFAVGFGSKAGLIPLHIWLPRGASGSAESRLGSDVGSDDQAWRLRPDSRRV